MGIDEPNHGPLTESMVVTSGTVVSGLLQPKVEPELAVFLARYPGRGCQASDRARTVDTYEIGIDHCPG